MLFTLAACSGTGTRDKSALLPVVRSSETAVFIQRKTERGNAVTMEVTLNGAKIAELGSYENTAAITKIGENTIVIRYSGFIGAFRDGHVSKFTMLPSQKRFFSSRMNVSTGWARWSLELTKRLKTNSFTTCATFDGLSLTKKMHLSQVCDV
jgi:hypothetical protein